MNFAFLILVALATLFMFWFWLRLVMLVRQPADVEAARRLNIEIARRAEERRKNWW